MLKRKSKRVLSIVLAVAMIVGLFPIAAFADDGTAGAEAKTISVDGKTKTLDTAVSEAKSGDTIQLTANIELDKQVTLPEGVTLDGQNHTISIQDDVTWSTDNSSKYMILVSNSNVTIKNVILDAENNAAGCIQFYATTDGKVENVTLKNAQNLGLMVNASTVTATDKLSLEGNGWGDVINVGWGSSIPDSVTSCSLDVSNAELVGVDKIYADDKDVENAGMVSSGSESKISIKVDASGDYIPVNDGNGITFIPTENVAATITDAYGKVEKYSTLQAAIAAVENGETIVIQRDIPDAVGISVPSGEDFTIDFNNHTYTLTGPGAGSSGTETNGFQLLKDSTIVFKNGTIKIAEGANKIKRIIQSYANVTFENMNFYAKNQVDGENYALSFNYGNVVFKGDSNIYVTDPSDTIAFDVYRWTPDYDNISVTFDENYSGTVQGTILYDSDDGTKGKLNIKGNGGTFTKIDTSAGSNDAAATGISVSGGKYANPLEPEWLEGLNAELYSQQNDLYSYFTNVDAALAAAQPGDKVVDLSATSTTTNYTVTIKYNNGDEDLTLTVPKNTELTLPAAPSREDYKFDGWIINGERYAAGEKVKITADTEISADWQPPYTGKYSYEIFTTVGDNGAIDVDRYATEGDKVTITVSPDEAYMLDELTVTTGGKEVEVKDNGDGTYTFKMPSADAKIVVTFAEDPDWEPAPEMPFTDVNEGDWFYDVVLYAYDNGLMTGVSATEFAPNQTTTRGMIVSMLARLEGVTSAEDAGFADVAANDWYATAVNWAASVGVVNGYEDDTFRPNAPITREQMAAILYNYADYKGYDVSARADLSDYADAASISSWAEDVLAWANAEGLINGMTATTIDPQGATTRAQTAAMFERFLTAHEA